jgi:hypothetical protein
MAALTVIRAYRTVRPLGPDSGITNSAVGIVAVDDEFGIGAAA